jgi:hypothetical protein
LELWEYRVIKSGFGLCRPRYFVLKFLIVLNLLYLSGGYRLNFNSDPLRKILLSSVQILEI